MIGRIYKLLTLASFVLLVYDFGYDQGPQQQRWVLSGYLVSTIFFTGFELYRVFSPNEKSHLLNILRLVLPSITFVIILIAWLLEPVTLFGAIVQFEVLFFLNVLLLLVFEFTIYISRLYTRALSPAFVFASSFAVLILSGTLLLKLPNATVQGISVLDALFTATSAVSVTGLAVVDTGTYFTRMGHWIILGLIQLGGLGVLTLTTFFAYFFKGSSSFQEDLHIKDFLSSETLGGLLELSIKIVVFTLGIELAAACLVFFNLPEGFFETLDDRLFFSLFHAVSAFCNAGFSTLTNGLYEGPMRFSYNVHLAIAFLVVTGGIGFNIVFNIFVYARFKALSWYNRFVLRLPKYHKTVRLVTLNTKIVLYTTGALILAGTVLFLILEQKHTLAEHPSWWGKLVTSLFGSITPRTAGFNTVNMSELAVPTVIITILLMWIGASPGSTGGGIKTSTFALASLNIFTTASGKNRVELGSREVPQHSINRAFAIISLSLIVIGIGILLITTVEPGLDFMHIAFEVFSAYSTVGLSLGITPGLSDFSKFVLIFVMFVGRVGSLNLLIGMIRQTKSLPYRYPQESVLIN
ncbi:MAG: hypothetical protein KBG02_06785 [Haliscomenobacter sp.]|nr:hypothetical protein [Haliscomenobacter sp.]